MAFRVEGMPGRPPCRPQRPPVSRPPTNPAARMRRLPMLRGVLGCVYCAPLSPQETAWKRLVAPGCPPHRPQRAHWEGLAGEGSGERGREGN
eukprot:10500060-Alexandrium_andersonii.AAC.1